MSEREWEELLTNIRRQMLINCWHGGGSAKSKLAGSSRLGVPKVAHQHRHRHRPGRRRATFGRNQRKRPFGSLWESCGTPSSPVELIDPYNKTSFEQKEAPRVSFDKVVTEAGLPPEEQARLAKSMLESTSSYGRAYRDKLPRILCCLWSPRRLCIRAACCSDRDDAGRLRLSDPSAEKLLTMPT